VALSSEEIKLVAVVVVATLGGNVGSILNSVNPDIRADAFTATMARQLHNTIDQEMERERKILRADILAEISERRTVEERDCAKYRQSIYDRLNRIENNQEHCMRMLKQHDGVKR